MNELMVSLALKRAELYTREAISYREMATKADRKGLYEQLAQVFDQHARENLELAQLFSKEEL